MIVPFIVFVVVTGILIGGYAAVMHLPDYLKRRQLDRRLRDVSAPAAAISPGDSVLMQATGGKLDRLLAGTRRGMWLGRLIEQSGTRTTPGAIVMFSLAAAVVAGLLTWVFTPPFARQAWMPFVAAALASVVPIAFLMRKRSARIRRFEEQFPEALDLLSRAIRAGHAFSTAMQMVADELTEPVGPEFKKTFEQQNFGLPLREALDAMTQRIPIIDVRFFVTAVLIQRETGGNLSEILDNLAHVVRERFKVLRQVRVHTAHGRFTGWVLLALPAALAVALMFINPAHMMVLFQEEMGKKMLIAAVVMQTIGYFWIKHVIKIEV